MSLVDAYNTFIEMAKQRGQLSTMFDAFESGFKSAQQAAAADKAELERKYRALYEASAQLLAHLVYHGEISARGDRAQALSDALHAIDGGTYQQAAAADKAELVEGLKDCRREMWHMEKQMRHSGWTTGQTVKDALDLSAALIAKHGGGE